MKGNCEKCCAFLDLLGFSYFVKNDESIRYAQYMLESSDITIEDRLRDTGKLADKVLEDLRKKNSFDNIDTILRGSDSIFFVGNSPDNFIEQVSTFVHSVFYYLGASFANPQDPNKPENIEEKIITSSGVVCEQSIWHPCLLRGGVSFGKVAEFESFNMHNKEILKSINILGKAVVAAVELEKCGPGPKLYVDDNFFNNLNEKHKSFVVTEKNNKTKKNTRYFLWTACIYEKEIGQVQLLQQFKMNIEPALSCLVAYINTEEVKHYFEFVKIHITGFLKFIKTAYPNDYDKIHKEVENFLAPYIKDLLINIITI